VPRRSEASPGQSRTILEDVFKPLPDGNNELPSFLSCGVGVLVLWGESSGARGSIARKVEVGWVESIVPKPGWTAPFLHRSNDERSEIHVRLLDVEEKNGKCSQRARKTSVILCPCHFICKVRLDTSPDGRTWRMDAEGLDRFRCMKKYMQELTGPRSNEGACGSVLVAAVEVAGQGEGALPAGLASIPSPMRSRTVMI